MEEIRRFVRGIDPSAVYQQDLSLLHCLKSMVINHERKIDKCKRAVFSMLQDRTVIKQLGTFLFSRQPTGDGADDRFYRQLQQDDELRHLFARIMLLPDQELGLVGHVENPDAGRDLLLRLREKCEMLEKLTRPLTPESMEDDEYEDDEDDEDEGEDENENEDQDQIQGHDGNNNEDRDRGNDRGNDDEDCDGDIDENIDENESSDDDSI